MINAPRKWQAFGPPVDCIIALWHKYGENNKLFLLFGGEISVVPIAQRNPPIRVAADEAFGQFACALRNFGPPDGIKNAAKQLFLLRDSFEIAKNCAPKRCEAPLPKRKAP
jgi:hypothetical protein